MNRVRLVCFGMAALAPTIAVWGSVQHGHAEDVGKLFTSRCASCHLPPDPAFRSDRAWVGQLLETA